MARPRNIMTVAGLAVAVSVLACGGAPTPGLERGEALFETCVPCHGADGGGNAALDVPAIAGLPAWYVQAQLENFQASRRGANPFDTVGLRMRSMSLSLDLEGDVSSVAQYVASMPRTSPPVTVQGDPAAGATAYQSCVACHGADGSGIETVHAPPLAGASDWYLLAQLQKFRKGWRGADPADTWGQAMKANAGTLPEGSLVNVVAYIATLRQAGTQP